MVRLHKEQSGVMNTLLVPLIVVGLLLVVVAVFAVMTFGSMQDYKNNSDEKSAAAASAAAKKEDAKKEAEFTAASNSQLKSYNGPAAYGSIQVQYPKAWSAYIIEQDNDSNSIDGYFSPNFVPSTISQDSTFALRVKVIGQQYASVLQSFQSTIKAQKVTATPFAIPKVPTVVGTKLTGQIQAQKQGTMVLVPLRANTLEIWTEGTTAQSVFDQYILPNVSFSP